MNAINLASAMQSYDSVHLYIQMGSAQAHPSASICIYRWMSAKAISLTSDG